MLSSPLFRVGDHITMRSDLRRHMPTYFLFGNQIIEDDTCVLQCDVDHGGQVGIVSHALDVATSSYPTCDFTETGYSGFQFIDDTMEEAHRVMCFLNSEA